VVAAASSGAVAVGPTARYALDPLDRADSNTVFHQNWAAKTVSHSVPIVSLQAYGICSICFSDRLSSVTDANNYAKTLTLQF
jgi:hypothetical protein